MKTAALIQSFIWCLIILFLFLFLFCSIKRVEWSGVRCLANCHLPFSFWHLTRARPTSSNPYWHNNCHHHSLGSLSSSSSSFLPAKWRPLFRWTFPTFLWYQSIDVPFAFACGLVPNDRCGGWVGGYHRFLHRSSDRKWFNWFSFSSISTWAIPNCVVYRPFWIQSNCRVVAVIGYFCQLKFEISSTIDLAKLFVCLFVCLSTKGYSPNEELHVCTK